MGLGEFETLTETLAPAFVEAGGKLGCEMFYNSDRQRRWYVYGIKPDGSRINCIVPRTGRRKEYATLDRLAAFNLRCHPNLDVLEIPFKTAEELKIEPAE